MHTTHLRRVGGSVMLAVPPALLDLLQLQAGATVGIMVDQGRLVVEPQRPLRYSLDDLLAQCDPAAEPTDEDRIWTGGKAASDEPAFVLLKYDTYRHLAGEQTGSILDLLRQDGPEADFEFQPERSAVPPDR